MTTDTALILLDYINEIVHPDGKLAAKGYSEYIESNGVYASAQEAIDRAQDNASPVFAVALGFEDTYADQPLTSPIFGKAADFEILRAGTWSTSYTDALQLPPDTVRLTKTRVSAFVATQLDQMLRLHGVTRIQIAGVATDLAVESTARAAHDLDYRVEVLATSCAAASREDHDRALKSMSKFAVVL